MIFGSIQIEIQHPTILGNTGTRLEASTISPSLKRFLEASTAVAKYFAFYEVWRGVDKLPEIGLHCVQFAAKYSIPISSGIYLLLITVVSRPYSPGMGNVAMTTRSGWKTNNQ